VELLGKLTGGLAAAEERPVLISLSFDDGRPVSPWIDQQLVPGEIIDVNAPNGGDGA
jgi:hypothetical protein